MFANLGFLGFEVDPENMVMVKMEGPFHWAKNECRAQTAQAQVRADRAAYNMLTAW